MKNYLYVLLPWVAYSCAHTEPIDVLVGEVKINNTGFIELKDCATGKGYILGTMADVSYFKLKKEIENLSIKNSVLVEVEGVVIHKKMEVESPAVNKVISGRCNQI
jgi:hypothetical protein